ncbi:PP2C family protein-serine/threonine phosphatase [Polyangium aurulentum]|uniref:PP2C family protein-serine/threonine phosphatase n=1 Tax=Polyangium aurulentum TaxID=2567896 RepID=UPI0010AEE116|nr:protein phosphatase 2C domain-containing protein [Polyangium aurulentum]UQA59634.1 protein phosphatase 2C domain-containing protein [Polyangium aurulentum]
MKSPEERHNALRQTDRRLVRSAARTDIGRYRKGNEDAFFLDDALGLYIVADGMGGHAGGEIASAEAVDTVHGMVRRGLPALGSLDGELSELQARAACRIMEGAIQAATYLIYAMAQIERDKLGMGTTISAALLLGQSLVTGQVGDSRIYRIRDGQALQLTEDHTLIAWQVKQGLLTADEAARSTSRNVITRAVGNRDYVEVDTSVLAVQGGDRYLLCSDGLHGYVAPDEIAEIAGLGAQAAVDRFIDVANERGGRDNITAVLVEIL